MNHSNIEATWLARIIRLFGFKELFDVVTNFANIALRHFGFGPGVGQHSPYSNKEAFWAILSLVIAIVLIRGARRLAVFAIGPRGSRKVARSLTIADSVWLSIGLRTFGVWLLLGSIGFVAQGFLLAVVDTSMLATTAGEAGSFYALWALTYGVVGWLLTRRPDVVGVLLMSSDTKATPEERS